MSTPVTNDSRERIDLGARVLEVAACKANVSCDARHRQGAAYKDSELYSIESELTQLLAKEGGLNLVAFTHRRHGNARPDNVYSLELSE